MTVDYYNNTLETVPITASSSYVIHIWQITYNANYIAITNLYLITQTYSTTEPQPYLMQMSQYALKYTTVINSVPSVYTLCIQNIILLHC